MLKFVRLTVLDLKKKNYFMITQFIHFLIFNSKSCLIYEIELINVF